MGTVEPQSIVHLMSTNVSCPSLREKMVTVGHGSCVLSMDEEWKQLCARR